MESRSLLGHINNSNKQKQVRCYGEQQQQQHLLEIHRHIKLAPSSKRSKRAAMKRVVSIPIKGNNNTNNNNKSGDRAPPADCWTWRKYGQKPIKGSPYPRGYYRCSSSKGCPARKQVERSHVDPTMLLITYSSDHNHSLPAPSKNQSTNDKAGAIISNNTTTNSDAEAEEQKQQVEESASMLTMEDDFGWLSGMDSAAAAPSFMMMESSMFGDDFGGGDHGEDSLQLPAMGEEDLSLFADLEELPECSAVFRRKTASEENMHNDTWFETTSL